MVTTTIDQSINGFAMKLDTNGQILWSSYINTGKTNTSNLSPIKIFTMLAIILTGFASISRFLSRPILQSTKVGISSHLDKIISPLFNSNSSLLYLFMGNDVIKDKEVISDFNAEVPKAIYDAKFLINPVRLAMTKLLYENIEFENSELKARLGLSWNEFNNNLNSMKKKNYVHIEQRFVSGRMQHFISLDSIIIKEFRQLKELLINFLTTSHNIDRYMEVALEIKDTEGDTNLYPN